ncbi:cyclin-I2 [Cervus canadensis]|uniref:cyclin-I2 n=1 Tax=Cervus canadensis TaxID=1574408 RepID=UPI001C9E7B85|nr:cyclin-I2 [Cervus canadensis]
MDNAAISFCEHVSFLLEFGRKSRRNGPSPSAPLAAVERLSLRRDPEKFLGGVPARCSPAPRTFVDQIRAGGNAGSASCSPRPSRSWGAAARTIYAAPSPQPAQAHAENLGRLPGPAPAARLPDAGPGPRGASVAGWPTPGTGTLAGPSRKHGHPPPSRAHGTRPGSTCTRDQQAEICEAFREVVLWLLRVENIFDFSQNTFSLALTIFSRLLVSVKIKKHLLHCVTITSLRLATKVNEEEELIPRVKDFIKHYGSGYSPNELLRMELAILDKLHWDLYIGTPLDFLFTVSTRNFQSLPWTHCAFGTAVHNIGRQSTRPYTCSTVT